jgi:hypothetical protein
MKRIAIVSAALLFAAAGVGLRAAGARTLVVTSSNEPANQLLVYDTQGSLLQALPTGGQGGASSNAGGIATDGGRLAVINFGSSSVSIFERRGAGFVLANTVPAASAPLSVTFGKGHLYVLGTATVESHRAGGDGVDPASDGFAALVHGDGSAAQVGVVGNQLIVSEKSNVVELVPLTGGAISGPASPVSLLPGSDTPFGFATRGANAYMTIAHSDQVALIRNGRVLATAATGTPGGDGQHSPCWAALVGPYLYTTNSPSLSISRLVATGDNVILDEAVAATTTGSPTDIAGAERLLAVVDGADGVSRLTQYAVDEGGNLTVAAQTTIAAPANGVAIVTN